jgi:uncharacterized membrane protein YkoI
MKPPVLCLLLLLLLPAGTAGASEQQRARDLVEQGRILPLTDIIAHARAVQPGRILEVELKRKRDVWLYELEILDAQGQVWELLLDASTGSVLQRKRED